MQRVSQSPTDLEFVQDPYPFYARLRAAGDLVWWEEYGMHAATTHRAVNALLRDRRFGREPPDTVPKPEIPAHLAPFYAVEAHSMLEAEPPRHTRLRGLVLRAFTTGRVSALTPAIDGLIAELIASFPAGPFDLLDAFARPLPVTVIARLIGVPDDRATDLLEWSNAMVKMYQPGRTRQDEADAVAATQSFTAYLHSVVAKRRAAPGGDLLSHLIAVEEDADDRLSVDELISTVILLLNAGHEATVHTLGNAVKALLETGTEHVLRDPAQIDTAVEEVLRYDPPLHVFTRIARQEVELFGHRFVPGEEVACLLASANRDPEAIPDPDRFDPTRAAKPHTSFGAGIHFCLGAPLARLEIARALPALFAARPALRLDAPPRYADIYHFHGLERLMVTG
ncbi:MAG: cytochrome P450 [Pseudomonadota bacterium]